MTLPKPSTTRLPSHSALVQARRKANRRNMQAPRPAVSPATKFRIRQWYADIETARDRRLDSPGKGISKGCDRYLKRIKGLRTVARGGFADVRDGVMADWLGVSRRTVLRYRAEALAAALLEDEGTKGIDHKPCMVRPILSDGTPVYTDNSVALAVPVLAHEPSESLPTELKPSPPTPSAQVAAPTRGGKNSLGNGSGAEARPEPITFDAFWAATDKGGAITAAAVAWREISHDDKLAIAVAIEREGSLRTGSSYVGNWLRHRRWPTLSVPTTVQAIGVRVRADAPNGEAWQRYWAQRRGSIKPLPTGRDGYFIKPLPTVWPPTEQT